MGGTEKPTQAGEQKDDDLKIDLDSVPVRVINVNLDGMTRTKNDYVHNAIQDVFKARNFKELIFQISEAQSNLKNLDVFLEVGSVVDTCKEPFAPNDAYEVTFIVKELKRYTGTVNTAVGSNEGTLKLAGKLPNLLGRGEKLTLDYVLSSSWDKNSELSFSKPFPNNAKQGSNLTTSLFYTRSSNILSGFNYASIGTLCGYSFKTPNEDTCQFQWEGAWRQIVAANASISVRQSCGHTVKSALKLIFGSDKRDQIMFPSTGYMLKYTSELAGLSGDAKFWKNDMEFQHNLPLFKGIVLQSSIRSGFLQPLSSAFTSCSIYDNFFLGGPQSLRGFAMRGIGPRQNQNSLGGKAFWSAALHIFSPLPYNVGRFSMSNVIRTHAFINAGSLSNSMLDDKFWKIRASCGLGIVLRLGNLVKIEVNYCYPLRFSKEDQGLDGPLEQIWRALPPTPSANHVHLRHSLSTPIARLSTYITYTYMMNNLTTSSVGGKLGMAKSARAVRPVPKIDAKHL